MIRYKSQRNWIISAPLTVIDTGFLHFCLEYRAVEFCGQEIELTAREFDIFALLILNPRRVFTYEMIADIVWNEPYNAYSKKTIINHISNLRKKLKMFPVFLRLFLAFWKIVSIMPCKGIERNSLSHLANPQAVRGRRAKRNFHEFQPIPACVVL